MNRTVWRYMPFSNFISLIVYQALWFSKLKILQDEFEGRMPPPTKEMMQSRDQTWKKVIPPELHPQLDGMASRNEDDSRELLVVSCWFLGEKESERMWTEYGMVRQSVAIKSTVRQLIENVGVPRDEHESHIGRVQYVKFADHMMDPYHANQGHERAFIKDSEKFGHEQELRIVTFSVKTQNCVSPEGKPYKAEDVEGKKVNNFENPGLYVAVRLNNLFSEIRTSPSAESWLHLLIKRIMELNNFPIKVRQSELLKN